MIEVSFTDVSNTFRCNIGESNNGVDVCPTDSSALFKELLISWSAAFSPSSSFTEIKNTNKKIKNKKQKNSFVMDLKECINDS